MLGKVIKHEMKDTGKLLLPLNLILVGITIIGMIMLRLQIFSNSHMVPLAASMAIVYILGLVAIVVVSFIYLAIRFYRSMYGAEGYLTHTLPVSTFSTLHGKLIVGTFWSFLSMVLAIASVFALVYAALSGIGEKIEWSAVFAGMESVMGISISALIAWTLLFCLLTAISGMLMIYACLSIGQLFNKYKVVAAFVTYIIIYIMRQIISTLTMVGSSSSQLNNLEVYADAAGNMTFNMGSFYGSIFAGTIIETLVFTVIFYIITVYICKKKLNLD